MIVLDASVVVDYLLDIEGQAAVFSETMQKETLSVPYLLDVEVAQVIRRFVARREISATRGLAAIQDLADFPAVRYDHRPFLPRVFCWRDNLTAYDAIYLALAEQLHATLWTRDHGLASFAKRVGIVCRLGV